MEAGAAGGVGRYTSGPWNALAGCRTLIEWDNRHPSFDVLQAEAQATMPMQRQLQRPEFACNGCSMGRSAGGDAAAGSPRERSCIARQPHACGGICGLQGQRERQAHPLPGGDLSSVTFGGRRPSSAGLARRTLIAERVNARPIWGDMAGDCRSFLHELSLQTHCPISPMWATGVALAPGLQRLQMRAAIDC